MDKDVNNEKINNENHGKDTGKTCPRCGSTILAFKRKNGLADKYVCSNENCNGVW